MEVASSLVQATKKRPGELPLFLAMATEGFWAQGARSFSSDVVGVRAKSVVPDASDVRPNSSVVRDALNGRSQLLASSGASASGPVDGLASPIPVAVGVPLEEQRAPP